MPGSCSGQLLQGRGPRKNKTCSFTGHIYEDGKWWCYHHKPRILRSSKTCGHCGQTKPLTEFVADRSRRDGRKDDCRICTKSAWIDYWKKNGAQMAVKNRAKVRHWELNNKPKRNFSDRARRTRGPTTNLSSQARYRLKLREAGIAAYGGACKCCGENIHEFLAFDHVDGDGFVHRETFTPGSSSLLRLLRDAGWPQDKIRLLCLNCNFSTYLGNGICAHARMAPPQSNLAPAVAQS